MRQCRDCGELKDILRFATFKDRQGNDKRRGVCWDCRGKYAKEHHEEMKQYRKDYNTRTRSERAVAAKERRQRAKDYANSRKDVPCVDCGQKWPPVAMDFDHVEEKTKGIAAMVSQGYKLELIAAEIDKCEVVCACCHRIRTAERKENVGKRQEQQ